MNNKPLLNKSILITGAARRIGRIFALACARAGANIVIHHGHSDAEAEALRDEIKGLGRQAWIFKADLNDSLQVQKLLPQVGESTDLHALVNSAAIFEPLSLSQTSLDDWQKHIRSEERRVGKECRSRCT